jgi:hypothetical protein
VRGFESSVFSQLLTAPSRFWGGRRDAAESGGGRSGSAVR